jgi:hypothetical protein
MAGFHTSEYGCLGIMTVGTFPMNCVAWDVVNLDVLWPAVNEVHRGENLALPRIAGRRSRPRRIDEMEVDLVIWIRGDINRTGTTTYTNWWQGLRANLADLRTNVFAPVETGAGTRSCSLTLPGGGAPLTAACQFDGLRPSGEIEDPLQALYSFTVTIPGGRFA